jgi:HK97 family phage portal protein
VTVLRALTRNLAEQRSIQSMPWGEWGDTGSSTWAGVRVNTDSAMQLLTVYGCNRFICEGISTLPVDVFRETADGARVEHRPPPWLLQPTADLDRVAWLTQILTSLLLDGNAYLRRVYDSEMRLVELVPLDPAKVKPFRRSDKSKGFRVNGVEVPNFEIVHIPGVMAPGADEGMSPVEAARQTIGSGLSAEEFAARFFSQGANMSGVIETPNDLSPTNAKTMADSFARRHSGVRKAHLPGVLVGGATWKATGVTQEQAQFLQTRQFTAAEICAFLFLIDPTEFGVSMDKGSSITYANLEQRNARKVQVTFLPWLVRLETVLSALLPQPRFLKFNVNGLLRGDLKTRYESYAIAIKNKFMTPNEAREHEDMEPLDGGDEVVETPAQPAGFASNGAAGLQVLNGAPNPQEEDFTPERQPWPSKHAR